MPCLSCGCFSTLWPKLLATCTWPFSRCAEPPPTSPTARDTWSTMPSKTPLPTATNTKANPWPRKARCTFWKGCAWCARRCPTWWERRLVSAPPSATWCREVSTFWRPRYAPSRSTSSPRWTVRKIDGTKRGTEPKRARKSQIPKCWNTSRCFVKTPSALYASKLTYHLCIDNL